MNSAFKSALFGLLVGLLALSNASPLDNTQSALGIWRSYVETYGKVYSSQEEHDKRQAQFFANYLDIQMHNRRYDRHEVSYQMGTNQFTDMSVEEFLSSSTGLIVPENPEPTPVNPEPILPTSVQVATPPANWDWRNASKILTNVKNQGSCGSCWAFATVVTLEAAYNMKQGSVIGNYSEQQLVDCDTADSACNGGYPTSAFAYVKSNGIATEAAYPYKAAKGTCSKTVAKTNISFTSYPKTNVNDATLQSYIYNYGPVVVGIDGTPLQNFKSGIFSGSSCSQLNHAVNVVGFVTSGTATPYYIVRNSWGPNWGESGYFKLSMTNACKIKEQVWYITLP